MKELIISRVCDRFGTSLEEIESVSRRHRNADARAAICYLMSRYSRMTLDEIGNAVRSDYGHSNVIHMIKKARNLIDTEPAFRDAIAECESSFGDPVKY